MSCEIYAIPLWIYTILCAWEEVYSLTVSNQQCGITEMWRRISSRDDFKLEVRHWCICKFYIATYRLYYLLLCARYTILHCTAMVIRTDVLVSTNIVYFHPFIAQPNMGLRQNLTHNVHPQSSMWCFYQHTSSDTPIQLVSYMYALWSCSYAKKKQFTFTAFAVFLTNLLKSAALNCKF